MFPHLFTDFFFFSEVNLPVHHKNSDKSRFLYELFASKGGAEVYLCTVEPPPEGGGGAWTGAHPQRSMPLHEEMASADSEEAKKYLDMLKKIIVENNYLLYF